MPRESDCWYCDKNKNCLTLKLIITVFVAKFLSKKLLTYIHQFELIIKSTYQWILEANSGFSVLQKQRTQTSIIFFCFHRIFPKTCQKLKTDRFFFYFFTPFQKFKRFRRRWRRRRQQFWFQSISSFASHWRHFWKFSLRNIFATLGRVEKKNCKWIKSCHQLLFLSICCCFVSRSVQLDKRVKFTGEEEYNNCNSSNNHKSRCWISNWSSLPFHLVSITTLFWPF